MENKRRLIYSDPDPDPPHPVPMNLINKLPDDLLAIILSKLTMKEAVRTSVLSHRWETLWVYYAGTLNFDNVDATFDTRRLSIERPRFISRVNNVLNLLQGSTFDEFRVCFVLGASNGDDIERWIKFAMEKTVSRFELDFSEIHGCNYNKLYLFPNKFLDSPNNLLGSFGSLTSLRLISVDLSSEVLAYLISNCHSLEHLSIIYATSLTYLNATTAMKLKHLEIKYCCRLTNVDISNTNIESLMFDGAWKTQLSLEKLHLLREVLLHGDWCLRVVTYRFLPLPISQLQRLELDFGVSFHMGEIEFAEEFPTFSNLKHLKVSLEASYDQNIFCITSLICASPLLNSFRLEVHYTKPCLFKPIYELPDCYWRNSEKRIHECLKVVEFIGWYGYDCDLDLAYYFIKNTAVLEKVIIAPELRYHFTSKRWVNDQHVKEYSRDRAKFLEKYLQPGMELVIV